MRSLGLCGSVFTIRVADRVSEGGGGRISEGLTPRNEGSSFSYKVSVQCPLLKVDGNSAQLIYPDTVVIFEV